MLSLTEKLTQDMKIALKNKEKEKLSTIRMVRSAIKKAEIDKKAQLTNDEIIEVIAREVKQRKDAIEKYEKAGREDLANKEKVELEVLESYLPKQLTDDELCDIIQNTIQQLGVTSKKEMKKIMETVLPQVKGRADGKRVSRLVQELLS